jgi:hypothetical protein
VADRVRLLASGRRAVAERLLARGLGRLLPLRVGGAARQQSGHHSRPVSREAGLPTMLRGLAHWHLCDLCGARPDASNIFQSKDACLLTRISAGLGFYLSAISRYVLNQRHPRPTKNLVQSRPCFSGGYALLHGQVQLSPAVRAAPRRGVSPCLFLMLRADLARRRA